MNVLQYSLHINSLDLSNYSVAIKQRDDFASIDFLERLQFCL